MIEINHEGGRIQSVRDGKLAVPAVGVSGWSDTHGEQCDHDRAAASQAAGTYSHARVCVNSGPAGRFGCQRIDDSARSGCAGGDGEAQRTHGGVFFTGPTASLGLFEHRRAGQWEQKRQIAIAASRLIEAHDTVLMDGGSTTYELARQLVGRPLQIVTNSLPLANLFATSEQVDLVILGGIVHSRTGVSMGPYANQMLSTLNVQKAVISIAGADDRGYYNSNLLLVETERAMMQAADTTIVVADSSKFGHSSLARLCELSDVDTVVSDDGWIMRGANDSRTPVSNYTWRRPRHRPNLSRRALAPVSPTPIKPKRITPPAARR